MQFDFTDALFFCQALHFPLAMHNAYGYYGYMNSAQHTTELALKKATDAWEATRSRLSAIIGLPLYNTCKRVETPQSLRDEIAALEALLPQQSAEIDRAYAAHLAANGLPR